MVTHAFYRVVQVTSRVTCPTSAGTPQRATWRSRMRQMQMGRRGGGMRMMMLRIMMEEEEEAEEAEM